MLKIGRNDPCPCGSEKKYKRCCLNAAEANKAGNGAPQLSSVSKVREGLAAGLRSARPEETQLEFVADPREDRLDELTRSVTTLRDEGRFDEALALCEELRRDYPEIIDGLDLAAELHESRREFALAADFYRRALAFTEQPDQHNSFDEDTRDFFREKIKELESRAQSVG